MLNSIIYEAKQRNQNPVLTLISVRDSTVLIESNQIILLDNMFTSFSVLADKITAKLRIRCSYFETAVESQLLVLRPGCTSPSQYGPLFYLTVVR